ncbi:hypothetical protein [Nonomuraea sp. NPDC049028]|uniref:hypothetical protein n=1 Tax=Nonomuraea sp. NPDC049028 TaxID=3364348 RepID=UPI003715487B
MRHRQRYQRDGQDPRQQHVSPPRPTISHNGPAYDLGRPEAAGRPARGSAYEKKSGASLTVASTGNLVRNVPKPLVKVPNDATVKADAGL